MKKTLVLGASANPSRYSNMAINKLKSHGHNVVAIGRREGEVAGIPILKEMNMQDDIDTVTLYMNAQNQAAYEEYILSLHPRRIIFNPGAENDSLEKAAGAQGIETLHACTLVMLGTGQY
ncbi:MAG: CoA-binding protein [Ferruginibacter sp.]